MYLEKLFRYLQTEFQLDSMKRYNDTGQNPMLGVETVPRVTTDAPRAKLTHLTTCMTGFTNSEDS